MNVTIVVPCFNEEKRLDQEAFVGLSRAPGVTVLFVDDGSSDATRDIISRLANDSDSIAALSLSKNVGKGNAIRAGISQAMASGVPIVAYLDADLATPPDEILRLLDVLASRPELSVVMGSRVKRLGSDIDRTNLRHFVGRVYASGAALALGISVYDTQCGAKVMRVSPALRAAFNDSFNSSWSFDARLILRLLKGSGSVTGLPVDAFYEVPLNSWREVPGSKLKMGNALHAFADLALIAIHRKRTERQRPR